MLYSRDTSGCYQPASKDIILAAARRLSSCQLRRGAAITSPLAAREAIGLKLAGLEYESFACLFLDGRHQVLAWRELFHGSVNRATVRQQAWHRLANSTTVALQPEWRDWLWDEVLQPERLYSFGNPQRRQAWRISWQEEELAERVRAGVREQALG